MPELTRDEVQDRLVDLVHGRLTGDERLAVERAVAADAALADELALLRSVHGALRTGPMVDVASIVAALPAPRAAVAPASAPVDDLAVRRAARHGSGMVRFARAAAILAVLGGGTVVALSRSRPSAVTDSVVALDVDSAARSAGLELSPGVSVDELSLDQLDALQADIRALDGLPSADLDDAVDLLDGEGA